MNLASICKRFETSRRREVLSFTHHAEVAALAPAEADAVLSRAAEEGLSTAQVRAIVRDKQDIKPLTIIFLSDQTLNDQTLNEFIRFDSCAHF